MGLKIRKNGKEENGLRANRRNRTAVGKKERRSRREIGEKNEREFPERNMDDQNSLAVRRQP